MDPPNLVSHGGEEQMSNRYTFRHVTGIIK
jgi:hypothetical protein